MKKVLGLACSSAFFLSAQFLRAQSPAPVNQTPTQVQSATAPEDRITYFSLEHRTPDQLEPADADLLKRRERDVLAEAEFYGYDMKARSWSYEQSVCPMIPGYLMLRYSRKNAAGAESLFIALVPRNDERILTVPVLYNSTTRFRPAPVDARNYKIFNQAVPAELAKKNSGPDGKWLELSVCYAEMTGARPQVPNQPQLDLHMMKAPPPTLHILVNGQEHEVRFADPLSPERFRLWAITYDGDGRIVNVSDEQHSFAEPVMLHPAKPTPKKQAQP